LIPLLMRLPRRRQTPAGKFYETIGGDAGAAPRKTGASAPARQALDPGEVRLAWRVDLDGAFDLDAASPGGAARWRRFA